jgi:hypothetical protein
MDDLKCPVVGCKREFSNRFNRDEHAEKGMAGRQESQTWPAKYV